MPLQQALDSLKKALHFGEKNDEKWDTDADRAYFAMQTAKNQAAREKASAALSSFPSSSSSSSPCLIPSLESEEPNLGKLSIEEEMEVREKTTALLFELCLAPKNDTREKLTHLTRQFPNLPVLMLVDLEEKMPSLQGLGMLQQEIADMKISVLQERDAERAKQLALIEESAATVLPSTPPRRLSIVSEVTAAMEQSRIEQQLQDQQVQQGPMN